jgi:hypothetical protein
MSNISFYQEIYETNNDSLSKIAQSIVVQLKPTMEDYILDPHTSTTHFINRTISYLESTYPNQEHLGHIIGHNNTKMEATVTNLKVDIFSYLSNIEPTTMYNIVMGLLPINSNNELTSLNICLNNLEEGGRCGIIVSNNLLFNTDKDYRNARRNLLKNYNVKEIVSLNKILINRTILFFDKKGKTKDVQFSEFDKNYEKTYIFKQNISTIKSNDFILEPLFYLSQPIKLSHDSEILLNMIYRYYRLSIKSIDTTPDEIKYIESNNILQFRKIIDMGKLDSNKIYCNLVKDINHFLKNMDNCQLPPVCKKALITIANLDYSNYMEDKILNSYGRNQLIDSIMIFYKTF